MLTYADLKSDLLGLGLTGKPVIAHASLKSFGWIEGGATTLLYALLDTTAALIMPTFTYKTMITPEVGPPNNGLTYGAEGDLNRMAEPFTMELPADPSMGIVPETLRQFQNARRTAHPIQSFAGVRADAALAAQITDDHLAPIGALAGQGGWALLLGVDHTVNTSIHYAEKLAGRKQFVRWALLPDRIIECPGFPGDSSGFSSIALDVEKDTRFVRVGNALVQAMPLDRLFAAVIDRIEQDPQALLCQRVDCERCNAVKESVSV